MAQKKGAGGKPQKYDNSSGKYVSDYTNIGTQELREQQTIELLSEKSFPLTEKQSSLIVWKQSTISVIH